MQAYRVLLLVSLFAFQPLWGNQLLSVDENAQTRLISCHFDKPVSPKTFFLSKPDRFIIDLKNVRLSQHLRVIKVKHKFIKRIRIGYPFRDQKILRLVIEKADPHFVIRLKQRTCGPKCFALDLVAEKKVNKKAILSDDCLSKEKTLKVTKKISDHSPASLPLKKRIEKPPFVVSAIQKPIIIALDPGHGGKDPGAIGPRGYAEKDITLAIAKQLQRQVNAQPNMRAVLTREEDQYIDLRQRLQIARQSNADVFISIHADAFINPESSGASVFALSQAGATSEAARWLAEKENYSELGGVNLSELDDESGLVRTVLLDLSQTATISASLQMGEGVLSKLKTVTKLHHTHVEQARFMVLKSPDIPSILIETGFISNPKEEIRLETESYQTLLTTAIVAGIKQYMATYPPALKLAHIETPAKKIDTLKIAASPKQYAVQSGDSLFKIALKHHVTLDQIKKANNLSTTVIKTGQKLTIPSVRSL